MSLRDALAFIARVRDDADLSRRLAALGRAAELDQLVALATESGFEVTADELREAHRREYAMRLARYDSASRDPSE